MMCGDNPETVEMDEAEFDRTCEGLFNAGRYEGIVGRKLTHEEIMTFTEGFIPATVASEVDYDDYKTLS